MDPELDEFDEVDAWAAFVDFLLVALIFFMLAFFLQTLSATRAELQKTVLIQERRKQDEAQATNTVEPVIKYLNSRLAIALNGQPPCDSQLDPWIADCVFGAVATFPTNGHQLSREGRELFEKFAEVVAPEAASDKLKCVVVEGHTDSVPTKDPDFTNWELSSYRAGAVVRFLEREAHPAIDGMLLSAQGHADKVPASVRPGEQPPVPDTPEYNERQRRVRIRLQFLRKGESKGCGAEQRVARGG